MKVKYPQLNPTLLNFVKIISMKNFLIILALSIFIYSCGTGNIPINASASETLKNDSFRIANDILEY